MTALDNVLRDTQTAYMHDSYGDASWRNIARFLLRQGHTEREAAAIMLSKHPRWADDSQGHGNGNGTTGAAFIRYYNIVGEHWDWDTEARQLADETW